MTEEKKQRIRNGHTYDDYKNSLIEAAKSIKINETDRRTINDNLKLIKKAEDNIILNDNVRNASKNITSKIIWLVMTDTTCDDSAEIIPCIKAISELNSNITLRIMLSKENPDIMDMFLTEGTRAIPKLICLIENSFEELWHWGPRPEQAKKILIKNKKEGEWNREEFMKELHEWYAEDKTVSVQDEIAYLLPNSDVQEISR